MAGQPFQPVGRLVLVVQTDQRNVFALGVFHQHRVFLQAGSAPGRPDVQQPHLAAHVLGRELFFGRVEQGSDENGRSLVNQGRGHHAGVAGQADGQKHHQNQKYAQGNQCFFHAVAPETSASDAVAAFFLR